MLLKLSRVALPRSVSKFISGLCWSATTSELFLTSDDKILTKVSADLVVSESPIIAPPPPSSSSAPSASAAAPSTPPHPFESYVTAMDLFAAGRVGAVSDVIVFGFSDGSLKIFSSTGKLEKAVPGAHVGAVTKVKFNGMGAEILSAGEDGQIKQWSRGGNLRSKLVSESLAITDCQWSPDGQSIVYSCGKFLTVRPISNAVKPTTWRAHEGTVTSIDWCPSRDLLISGSEDGKYKIFDPFGMEIFSSRPFESAVQSVRWSPSGDFFSVGLFNAVVLCDRMGWMHCREQCDSGSLHQQQWTPDSTQVILGGANGAVFFASVVDRSAEWKSIECRMVSSNEIAVYDQLTVQADGGNSSSSSAPSSSATETLEFQQRIIDFSLRFGFLIVVTTKSTFIYSTSSFATPQLFDHGKSGISLIVQGEKSFALIDKTTGISVYSYDGKVLSKPQLPPNTTIALQNIKGDAISLTVDCLSLLDKSTGLIHLIDPTSGKKLGEPIGFPEKERVDISCIQLSNTGLINDRKLLLLDRNRDLYITPIHKPQIVKLCSQVESARWSDVVDVIAYVSDGRWGAWILPQLAFIDRDLLTMAKMTGTDDLSQSSHSSSLSSTHSSPNGKSCEIVSFVEFRPLIRKSDGSFASFSISPAVALLNKSISQNQWSRAVRLCRVAAEDSLWAALAGVAIAAAQFDTAEIALSAIEMVEKVQFVQHIKSIPSNEGRAAEVALYRKQIDLAENILINGDLKWKAILLNIQLNRWLHALDLAVKFNQFIDLVIGCREIYLNSVGRVETEEKFLGVKEKSKIVVEWDAINGRIESEMKKESSRQQLYKSSLRSFDFPAAKSFHVDYWRPIGTKNVIHSTGGEQKSQEKTESGGGGGGGEMD